MYHEAKKYEKKVKEILVDYRKRAERRQSFYQKIKTDPTQFLQIHGRKCKIHIDTSSGGQDIGTMMKWNNDVMIDRFDARAHLDFIPQTTCKTGKDNDEELCMEERQLNYERFRILILNEFLCLKEQDFLNQLDEMYEVNAQNDIKSKKKRQTNKPGVSIGYTYDTEDYSSHSFIQNIATVQTKTQKNRYDDLAKDSSESDMDLDLPIDINKVSTVDANELNATGRRYGMMSNDFFSFITNDIDELQALKESQKEECSKTSRTGRRERRERREQKMRPGSSAIPSYAKADNEYDKDRYDNQVEEESSESNTDVPEKITYITSFGNEERKSVEESNRRFKPLYSEKLKENLEKFKNCDKRKRSSRYRSSSTSSSSTSDYYRRRKSKKRRYRISSSSSNQSSKVEKSRTHTSSKDAKKDEEMPIKRYYGRNRNSSDSSSLSYDEQNNHNESIKQNNIVHYGYQSRGGNSSTNAKGSNQSTGETKTNPKERLKRKMQILLNKQYKEDKKIETLKKLQQIEEQKERETEMKELALKLRKRQRELRHQYSSSEQEETRDRDNSKPKYTKRSRSRSVSSSSSESSKSSYCRLKYDSSKFHRNGSPEPSKYYLDKNEKYDSRRTHNFRDKRSPDRYSRKKNRYRSRSSDRYSSRNRKY